MERSKIIRIHECRMSVDGSIIAPVDDYSNLVLKNLITSCENYYDEEIIDKIPQQPESTLPFHNLYLSFYAGAFGTAMILQYAFTYAVTKDAKYGKRASEWLLASIRWDHTLFSFYCSARLMHAIVAGVDWISDLLSDREIGEVYLYLKKLCQHHEKQAMEMCANKETGGHPNLYLAGFGVACLALISAGNEPKAESWLKAVIAKYERNLLPDDASVDGTYQPDGNWCIEYAFRYKFIFLDALRLVTGRDLIKEHYSEVTRPMKYLAYAYMGDGKVPVRDLYEKNGNMLDSYQINAFGSLYLRFASLIGDPYLQWIGMSNPVAGRIQAYGNKVKGGHRFIYPVGYTDYLWYDPRIKPQFAPPADTARLFPDGELAVLRTSFDKGLTVAYQGRRGNVMYESPDLIVNKNGRAMFCQAPVMDSLPLAEANGPAAGGGEMERKGVIKRLVHKDENDVLKIEGFLTRQTIKVSHQKDDVIDVHISRRERKPEEVSLQQEEGGGYLRLRREGYLQYEARKNFNPNQGVIKLEFRLSRAPSKSVDHPAVLFSIGQHLKYMFGNAMFIGFLEDGRLGVKCKDSEGRWLFAHFSRELPLVQPHFWHSATVYWKNFNIKGCDPTCGIILGEYHTEARLTMPALKAFQCHPNTTLWVGAAVQMPDSFAEADIRRISIYGRCPRYKNGIAPREEDLLFAADYGKGMDAVFASGSGSEVSGQGLEYRFHAPVCEGKQVLRHRDFIEVANDGESVYISGTDAEITMETLPMLRSGFAGQSFETEETQPVFKRIIIRPSSEKSDLNFKIMAKMPHSL